MFFFTFSVLLVQYNVDSIEFLYLPRFSSNEMSNETSKLSAAINNSGLIYNEKYPPLSNKSLTLISRLVWSYFIIKRIKYAHFELTFLKMIHDRRLVCMFSVFYEKQIRQGSKKK